MVVDSYSYTSFSDKNGNSLPTEIFGKNPKTPIGELEVRRAAANEKAKKIAEIQAHFDKLSPEEKDAKIKEFGARLNNSYEV